MTRRQLIWSRILFAVYLAAVAFLCFGQFSSSQDVPMDLWGIPTDKVVHFLMFFPFPLLACLAFGARLPRRLRFRRRHRVGPDPAPLPVG